MVFAPVAGVLLSCPSSRPSAASRTMSGSRPNSSRSRSFTSMASPPYRGDTPYAPAAKRRASKRSDDDGGLDRRASMALVHREQVAAGAEHGPGALAGDTQRLGFEHLAMSHL